MEPSSLESQSQELTVGPGEGGRRLDLFLSEKMPSFSRSRIQSLLKEDQVQPLFETKRGIKPGMLVVEGQRFRVTVPAARPSGIRAQAMDLDIVFEDAQVLVIHKPAGLVVHPGAGNPDQTLINALVAHCPKITGVGGVQRPGLVHRLDKDTSGLLVVAKTDKAYQSLVKQLRYRQLTREYLGIVKGKVEKAGLIDAPIGRHIFARKKMAVRPNDGKSARTHFVVLGSNEEASLLHLKLETGRTHQIRVHLQFIHHPILGDEVYGTASEVAGRQMLHAFRIAFKHPSTGMTKSFFVPPPKDFTDCLKGMGLKAPAWKGLTWTG